MLFQSETASRLNTCTEIGSLDWKTPARIGWPYWLSGRWKRTVLRVVAEIEQSKGIDMNNKSKHKEKKETKSSLLYRTRTQDPPPSLIGTTKRVFHIGDTP